METKREISLNLPFCLLCKDRRRLEPVRAADAQNPHRIESLVLAKSFEEKITKIGGADYMFIGDGQNIHACHCLLITWLSQKGFQIAKSYLMILRSCRSKLKNLKLCHFLHVFFFFKKNKGLFLLSVQSYRLLLFWVFVMFSSRVGVVKNRSSYHVLMIQQSWIPGKFLISPLSIDLIWFVLNCFFYVDPNLVWKLLA